MSSSNGSAHPSHPSIDAHLQPVCGEITFGRHDDGVLLIRLRGDFDFGNVEMLRRTLRSVSSPVGSRIALDAAEVTFIDVVSIEAILAARHEQRAAGRDLVIVNPSRPVRRLIQLAGLERELTRRPFRLGVARAAR